MNGDRQREETQIVDPKTAYLQIPTAGTVEGERPTVAPKIIGKILKKVLG